MSGREQPLDARGFVMALRRHAASILVAMLIGAALGVGAVTLHPFGWSSTAKVLLPASSVGSDGQPVERDTQTYLEVATSNAVLDPVSKADGSSVRALAKRLTVKAPSQDVIVIQAHGDSAASARSLARATGRSFRAYLRDASSSLDDAQQTALRERLDTLGTSLTAVQTEITQARQRAQQQAPTSEDGRATATAIAQLTAQEARLVLSLEDVRKEQAADDRAEPGALTAQARLIQDASPATRTPLWLVRTAAGVVGAILGLLVALVVAGLVRRRRRRLWSRDALAAAMGVPVVASLRGETPSSARGWARVLASYEPSPTDAWSLRQVLRDQVLSAHGSSSGLRVVDTSHGPTVLVAVLSDDEPALALAPQLASYAAALDVSTRFVAGQRHKTADRLWAACTRGRRHATPRENLRADTSPYLEDTDELTVVLAVLDRKQPQLELRDAPDAVLVACSPGTTTADDLARLAIALDDRGCGVDGLVVMDPEGLDRTSGRDVEPAPVVVPEQRVPAQVVPVAGRRRRRR